MPRYVVGTMRRLITLVVLAGAAAGVLVASAPGAAVSPAQLAKAGWTCFLPPPFNPNVHCAPPGQFEAIESGQARAGMFVAFATNDLNATSAPRLGNERLIRGDLFHGQPCPTDPPDGPPGASTRPPLYEWSWLYPRFGWDYYICHTFDSPW
jgi:hypothetical protein